MMDSSTALSDHVPVNNTHTGPAAARSVVLVSKQHRFRRAIAAILDQDVGFELIAQVAIWQDAASLALRRSIDIVLLDLDEETPRLISDFKETGLDVLVIALATSGAERELLAALDNGADGYLLKTSEPSVLLGQLRTVASGQAVLDPALTGTLVEQLCRANRKPHSTLTKRECEVVQLIANAQSNKAIARTLEISDSTVKVHVRNLFNKLKFRSRLEVAVWALREGIAE